MFIDPTFPLEGDRGWSSLSGGRLLVFLRQNSRGYFAINRS